MTFELWILFAAGFLQYILIHIHAGSTAVSAGIWWGIGRRDTKIIPSDFMRRSERSLINTMESYFVFIPFLFVGIFTDYPDWVFRSACVVFLGCRLAFVLIYLANIPILRSLIWGIGMLSLLTMMIRLAFYMLPFAA